MMKLEKLQQDKEMIILDYQYLKDHFQSTAVDLSKQNKLDTDPRAIQQFHFYGMWESNSEVQKYVQF